MTGGPDHLTGGDEHQAKVRHLHNQLQARGYTVVMPHGSAPPILATNSEGDLAAVAIQRGKSPGHYERAYRYWSRVKIVDAPEGERRQVETHVRDRLRARGLTAIRTQAKSPDLVATDGEQIIAVEVVTWGDSQGPGSLQNHVERKRSAYHTFDHVAVHPVPADVFPPLEPEQGLPDTDLADLIET